MIIHVNVSDMDVRTPDNPVTRILPTQFLQLGDLRDIRIQTKNGSTRPKLKMDFGGNASLRYNIEANEMLDKVMHLLPEGLQRPRVVLPGTHRTISP